MAAERMFSFAAIKRHAYVPVTDDNLLYAPELISVVNGNGGDYARQLLARICKKDFDRNKIIERKINNSKIKLISFADAIPLIMVIPGKITDQTREKFADIIQRYNGGERSLIVEINANAQSDDQIALMARDSLAAEENSHVEPPLILKRKCEELDHHIRENLEGFEFIATSVNWLAAIRNHEHLDDEEKQKLRALCLRIVERN